MKISSKIISTVVTGLVLLGILATVISVYSLIRRGKIETESARALLLENRKNKLQDLVRNVVNIAENAYRNAHDPKKITAVYSKPLNNAVDLAYSVIESVYNEEVITDEDAKKRHAMENVKKMRYNGTDYFWINDMHPAMIMHPFKPDLDGKDLSDFKDTEGKKLFIEMTKVCQANGGGFVDYMWPKPGADKPVKKLSYVKLFKPWNWVVGSGVYMELAEEEIKKDTINVIENLRYGPEIKDYFWINDINLKMVMHPYKPELNGQDLSGFKDPDGKYLFKEMVEVCKANGGGFVDYMWSKPGFDKPVQKISYVHLFKEWGWVVGTGIYLDDVQELISIREKEISLNITSQIFKLIALVAGVCLVLSFGTLFLVKWKITRPIIQTSNMLKDIAEGEGDLTKRLKVSSKDELGDMSKWFNLFIDKLRGIISEIGNNAITLNDSSKKLSYLSEQLTDSAKTMSSRSDSVTRSCQGMSKNMISVADNMTQGASNVNLVAAATEEMTSTINEIAENTEKALAISNKAVSQMESTALKIIELGSSAQDISKITEVISEISEQTNLLALNATIEAARAGESGKGFAVVANEIKELARQTAEATKKIKKQIEGIQGSSATSISDIKSISVVIADVNQMITSISASVEEQSATTGEIANNVSQFSYGIQEANENVCRSSDTADEITKDMDNMNRAFSEIADSSVQIKNSAEELNNLAGALNSLVSKFKV